jgi:lactate dehydrogenase-like 2-hydroxyacid dehydrogenase
VFEGCLDSLDGHELVFGGPGLSEGREAVALLCGPTEPVTASMLSRLGELCVISVAGAGSDAIDHEACRARGVSVLTSGEPLVETTADLAFGLMVAACRGFHDAEMTLRSGEWGGWRFDDVAGRDVHGSRLGLIGYGRIARAVARRAAGFNVTIRHHTRTPTGEPGWTEDLDELLGWSEIVSVHVPLDDSTRGLIDRRRIGLLKEDAVLVNTARGAVLDELALAEALNDGRLLGAGLDVYDGEPEIAPQLRSAPRTILLPHIGSATCATRRAMLRAAAEKVAGALAE